MFKDDDDLFNIILDEVKLQRELVNNETLSVIVIHKDTHEILFSNKWANEFFIDVQQGNTLDRLKENKKARKAVELFGEWLDLDIKTILSHKIHSERDWILKNIEVNYKNQKAIMLYCQNTDQYIREINKFDTLTNSLSYTGLQQYYYEIIKTNDFNYGLCTLDVDKFKYINNLFSYEVGDTILYSIGYTLQKFVKEDEAYCRINEDKFAIFLKYNTMQDLEARVEALKETFKVMQEKKYPNKKLTIVGGICIVDKNKDLHRIMDKANIARKTTKGSHDNKFRFYDESLQKESKKEKMIEERMLIAVKNDEFEPFLQAKFDLHTNKICGAEALVRWITPTGMIYPDEFIPIFEKNGFICTLDFIMYDKVLKHMRECLDNNIDICPISLNVSRGHIKNENFSDRIINLLNKYNISLDLIELEVTESAFVEDKSCLQYFIGKLKECNIKVSIDDFGTAYSSLNVLKDVEVDILKIDKEFLQSINFIKVTEIPTKDRIIIKHIISMAKDLSFHVICEGVETLEQLEFLKEIGCELGQGYYFAKPMPIPEFMERFYPE